MRFNGEINNIQTHILFIDSLAIAITKFKRNKIKERENKDAYRCRHLLNSGDSYSTFLSYTPL